MLPRGQRFRNLTPGWLEWRRRKAILEQGIFAFDFSLDSCRESCIINIHKTGLLEQKAGDVNRRKPRTGRDADEREIRSRIARSIVSDELIHGTLTVRQQKCGKPNCHCVDGPRHRALYLTVRSDGKPRQVFVPAQLEQTVQQWVECDHRVQQLLRELNEHRIELLQKLKDRNATEKQAPTKAGPGRKKTKKKRARKVRGNGKTQSRKRKPEREGEG